MDVPNSIRTAGKRLYGLWMRFAHVLAVVNTTVLLTVIYVVLIGPIGLIMRLFGNDPLERRWKADGSYWRARETGEDSIESVRHQF